MRVLHLLFSLSLLVRYCKGVIFLWLTLDTLMRTSNLTSLDSLRIFEAAARHANFTVAARELHSTQSAVSQRIRALEQQLGLRLFERVHRGVSLTAAGRTLLLSVQDGLATIDHSVARLQHQQHRPSLNILTDFAFAAYWLLPRLPQFRRRHPHIDVQIITDQGGTDWRGRDIDIAIVFCDEQDLLQVPRLFGEEVLPVCSPSFLDRHGPVTDLQTLSGMPLLSLTADQQAKWLDWPRYFHQQGGPAQSAASHLAFNNYTLMMQAAIAGHGIALGWRELVDEQLQNKMLVGLRGMQLRTARGYGLIDADPDTPSRARTALYRWLINNA